VDLRGTTVTAATIPLTDKILSSDVQLVLSDGVLARVAAKYPDMDVEQLRSEVSASDLPNTQELQITVQDANAARAASLANDIATALVNLRLGEIQADNLASEQQVRAQMDATQNQIDAISLSLAQLGNPPNDPGKAASLSAQLSGLKDQLSQQKLTLSRIQVAEAADAYMLWVPGFAQPSSAPTRPRVALTAGTGVAAGTVLGVLLALLVDRLRRRHLTVEAVAAALACPLLAELRPMRVRDADGAALQAEYDALGGACRSLARALDFLNLARPVHTIAITSVDRSATSSALASALSLYLAAAGRRVLLIDARLSGGRQSMQFGVPASPGLSNAALETRASGTAEVALERYLYTPQSVHAPLLRVIPTGALPPNPNEVLASDAMRHVLAQAIAGPFDMVIVDVPPATTAAVCQTLGAIADGAFIVVNTKRAHEDVLVRVRSELAAAGLALLGCVVSSEASLESAHTSRTLDTASQRDGNSVETLLSRSRS
jgi:Mrp family chromosome partitioning ATPase